MIRTETSHRHCRACTDCLVTLHESYFATRIRNGQKRKVSICRACMRERWRRWNNSSRGRKGRPQEVIAAPSRDLMSAWPVLERVALVWRIAA